MSIDGVTLRALKTFADHRGKLLTMVREDTPGFTRFAEAYFSCINAGVTKGWKLHREMTQLISCPVGMVKVVLFDGREAAATRGQVMECELGAANYQLLRIPPGVWYAIRAVSPEQAMIANVTDMVHDNQEVRELPLDTAEIPYRWA